MSNNSSEKACIADPFTDVFLLLSASYTLETLMVESKCDVQNIYQPENTRTVQVGVLCIPAEQELDLRAPQDKDAFPLVPCAGEELGKGFSENDAERGRRLRERWSPD